MIFSARMSSGRPRGSGPARPYLSGRESRLRERPSLEQGDDEERQPGQKDARADTPIEAEIERRPRQAGSQEELVQRTAQDERELSGIGRFGSTCPEVPCPLPAVALWCECWSSP